MNILPKKRWHVRTKENIARVRKDEAEAAEKERLEQQRINNADREARLNVLKLESKQRLLDAGTSVPVEEEVPEQGTHINLFIDLVHAVQTTNKEHDNEVKEKKEEYEKKIGYLTFLGQDTNEALKKKNWYETLPENSRFSRSSDIRNTYDKLILKDSEGKPKNQELDIKNGEVSWRSKQKLDPINSFKMYCSGYAVTSKEAKKDTRKECKNYSTSRKEKREKNKKSKNSKKEKYELKKLNLEKLRQARLKREQEEKYKTENFLAGLSGSIPSEKEPTVPKVKPKYNSQFNPELARQNYTLH